MTFLLDTNTCIYFLNEASENVTSQFKRRSPSEIKLPSITVAELFYGAEKSKAKARNRDIVDRFVSTFEILPFDDSCSRVYGKIRTSLEKSGTPIGAMDLLIASIAISHNSVLVTNNSREFKRVKGLQVANWV